jgi:hypothetical protein
MALQKCITLSYIVLIKDKTFFGSLHGRLQITNLSQITWNISKDFRKKRISFKITQSITLAYLFYWNIEKNIIITWAQNVRILLHYKVNDDSLCLTSKYHCISLLHNRNLWSFIPFILCNNGKINYLSNRNQRLWSKYRSTRWLIIIVKDLKGNK